MHKKHEYPKFLYHKEKDPIVVQDEVSHKELGSGWEESPFEKSEALRVPKKIESEEIIEIPEQMDIEESLEGKDKKGKKAKK